MSAKKKRKRKKKSGALLGRILIVVIVLAALGVLIWQLRGLTSRNATTAIARAGVLGDEYAGSVVIARNETLYATENKTRVDFIASEGSHVPRSNVICKVYSSGYNQTEINRLQSYREEIQDYHVGQVFSTYVDAALDANNDEVSSLAQQVRTLVQGRGVGSLSNLETQLQSALNVRKNYLRQKYPDDQTLSGLYKVENDQLKKIESWTTTYTANEDCIVSFYTDGFESTVNANTYSALTPADVRNVIRGVVPQQTTAVQRGSDPIFRTVVEDEWYALFLCTDREWNPVVGEQYQMQLTGFDNYVLPAQVESFTRIGGDLLLRMRVKSSVEPVLNIRTCGATVGDFVSGVYVPIRALYTLDNMIGVVVLEGGLQTFVPVTVISYPDEETAFVRPTLSGSPLSEGKTIMLF
ncbi:MAG: hypothetical protein IJ418_14190 [Clostridia bacterium]|nr:hypothetical protein [Clostridia bacterium]